jgi:hypothetical protein
MMKVILAVVGILLLLGGAAYLYMMSKSVTVGNTRFYGHGPGFYQPLCAPGTPCAAGANPTVNPYLYVASGIGATACQQAAANATGPVGAWDIVGKDPNTADCHVYTQASVDGKLLAYNRTSDPNYAASLAYSKSMFGAP